MRSQGAESTLSLPLLLVLIAAAVDSSAAAAPAPRRIEDKAPLTGAVPQGSYEEGVRGRVAQAQNLKGPLDGGWIVRDQAGAALFRFQLVDPGFAGGVIEGVWLDAATGGPTGTGFFDSIERNAFATTLRMARGTLTLTPRSEGGWAGEFSAPSGRRAVTMTRP